MIKILSLFSGLGAFEKALERQKIKHEVVNYCEIDKYASKAYSLLHNIPESMNLGDITKVDTDKLSEFDLMTWGFPCQDISIAGNQKGIIEGETRSGLYYEGYRILKAKMPKYSIIENVKALVCKKFKADFDRILSDIEDLGYNNYWQVLNAKDYGIPQNRERVFLISIRKDVDDGSFEFAKGFDNGIRLKDLLESEVDEKYYISQEKTDKLLLQLKDKEIGEGSLLQERNGTFGEIDVHSPNGISPAITSTCYKGPDMVIEKINGCIGNVNPSGNGMNGKVYSGDTCPTLTTNKGEGLKVLVKEATKQGYAVATEGDSINLQFPDSKTRRGRVGHEVAQTLETSRNQGVLVVDDTQGFDGVRSYDDIVPTLRSQRSGIKVVEPNECIIAGNLNHYGNDQMNRVYDPEGISPSILTVTGGGREQKILVEKSPSPELVGGIGELNFGKQYRQGNRIYSAESTAMAILSQPVGNAGGNSYLYQIDYRIRKLTPLECFRLMGFDDQDFYTLKQSGISDSQLYKMAGNSIVVDVLEPMLERLFRNEIASETSFILKSTEFSVEQLIKFHRVIHEVAI